MTAIVEQTVLPPQSTTVLAEIIEVLSSPGSKEIVGSNGTRARVPDDVIAAIRSMVEALEGGQAITLAPHGLKMTTQDAADFLGVSRPTVVRLLERGEIPFEKPGRHRRIRLADLLDYQRESMSERRRILDDISREAEDDGLSGGGFVATR